MNYSLDTEFITIVNSVTGELFMSRRGQHLFNDIKGASLAWRYVYGTNCYGNLDPKKKFSDQGVWVAKKVKLVEVLN